FFFSSRRRHTRFSRDWSSDVCSSDLKTRFDCEIKNFDPLSFLDRKEARKIDRFSQTSLVVSDQAVLDAGLNGDNINKDRVGVIRSEERREGKRVDLGRRRSRYINAYR